MKNFFWAGIVAGVLFLAPLAAAEDQVKNPLLDPPLIWGKETALYPFRIVGSFLGREGNPEENLNYGGYNGKYGFYESISDESLYRYERWGVN